MTAYLVDTNVLLRLVKPDDRDYPLVRSAVQQLWAVGEHLCYTSQNLAEFWNTCTRPAERNGYGLSIPEADRRARHVEDQLVFLEDTSRSFRVRRASARRAAGGCHARSPGHASAHLQYAGFCAVYWDRSCASAKRRLIDLPVIVSGDLCRPLALLLNVLDHGVQSAHQVAQIDLHIAAIFPLSVSPTVV